ncbi:unnamed protein product [Heterobilharzia americana]|nr:unnamed protein product [Heterobilharzia americana]CAH8620975.1 unnamed protein product [Heterobilharzia americana]
MLTKFLLHLIVFLLIVSILDLTISKKSKERRKERSSNPKHMKAYRKSDGVSTTRDHHLSVLGVITSITISTQLSVYL